MPHLSPRAVVVVALASVVAGGYLVDRPQAQATEQIQIRVRICVGSTAPRENCGPWPRRTRGQRAGKPYWGVRNAHAAGTVSAPLARIQCPDKCAGRGETGERIEFTATRGDAGFTRWAEACRGAAANPTCELTIKSRKTGYVVVAIFGQK